MTGTHKPYQFSLFKMRLRQGLTYRTAALAGVATQFFWGMILIMMFTAFYGETEAVNGFSRSHLVSYIWLQQAFLAFIALWMRDSDLFALIESGNIAYELCRPINLYAFWYTKLLSTRLSSAALRCLPILLVALFIPKPYNLILPGSGVTLIMFILSLLLGVMINVAISMFIYISVFITLSPTGSLLLFSVVGEFLAGMVIPIPLMPEALRQILNFLPFRYTADLPFRIYSGNLSRTESITGIIIQLVWLILLPVIGDWLMKKALKHLVVQGG